MLRAWIIICLFLYCAGISGHPKVLTSLFIQLSSLEVINSFIFVGWEQIWGKHAETGIHMDRWTSGQIQGQVCSCHVNVWWHSARPSCRSSFIPDSHKIRFLIALWNILSLLFQRGYIISLARNPCQAPEMLKYERLESLTPMTLERWKVNMGIEVGKNYIENEWRESNRVKKGTIREESNWASLCILKEQIKGCRLR